MTWVREGDRLSHVTHLLIHCVFVVRIRWKQWYNSCPLLLPVDAEKPTGSIAPSLRIRQVAYRPSYGWILLDVLLILSAQLSAVYISSNSGFHVNYYSKEGGIQGLRFTCTDGEASGWFGGNDGLDIREDSFDVGLSSIKSQQITLSSTYLGRLFLQGYDLILGSMMNETIRGPYG